MTSIIKSFAWFCLIVLMAASIAVNFYMFDTVVDLQNEVTALSRKADRAFNTANELQRDIDAASGKADSAYQSSSEIQTQIDTTMAMAGVGVDYAVEFAKNKLDEIENESINLVYPFNQDVLVDTNVPINTTFDIPFNQTIYVDTTVTVPVEIPTQQIDPLNVFKLPSTFMVDIPIKTNVPINLDLQVPINQTMYINTVVPMNLDIPISLAIRDIPFAAKQIAEFRALLEQLTDAKTIFESPVSSSTSSGGRGSSPIVGAVSEILKGFVFDAFPELRGAGPS